MMGNMATLLADLGDRWPGCASDMTPDVALGLQMAQALYNLQTAAVAETRRVQLNETMAAAFEQVDLIIASTNPGPAFPAEDEQSSREESFIDWAKASTPARYAFRGALFGTHLASVVAPKVPTFLIGHAARRFPELVNMGAMTIVSNIYGNPAVSIPAGTLDGLPIGMQVLARHHQDDLLFDVALAVERTRPWPVVVPAPVPTPERPALPTA
jgi:aspartyl-tRNA(Asn)/glutamyl-tRNA(Gln) amidotransferase subunit A